MKKNIKIIAALLAAFTLFLCLPVNLLALETEITEDISEEYSSTEALETVEPEENEQASDTPPNLTETDLETETMIFEEIEDEYILPPTSLDNIQIGDMTEGNASLMSTHVTSSQPPDGVYALQNVGNPGMWMSIEQSNSDPGYNVQQLAYTNSTYNNNPADSFERSCLFKISKKPGTTNQYIIRLMLNNRLSFGFSGDEVITKIIDPIDANVADADTFTIKHSSSGYVIRPYGSTSAVCAPTSTTSESNLIKMVAGNAGTRSTWQLYQYTGAHRSGTTIYFSASWRSVGIPVGTIGSMSTKTWTTRIGANNPYMMEDVGYENMIITSYSSFRMSFVAVSPGKVCIRAMILEGDSEPATYTGRHYFQIIPQEGTYYIRNFGTEKYIDIEGPSTAENAIIQQWDFSTASQKQWIIEHASDGYVRIKSAYSNKYIGVNSANTSQIRQYSTLNNYTLWKFERTSSGNLKLVCKALSTSFVLAPSSASAGADLTLVTYTDNSDYNDEWNLYQIKYSYTLHHYYDYGYNERFSDENGSALEKITSYHLAVSERLMRIFGVITYGEYTLYESSADYCKQELFGDDYLDHLADGICNHGENDNNIHLERLDLIGGLTSSNILTAVVWTGHVLPGDPRSIAVGKQIVVITPYWTVNGNNENMENNIVEFQSIYSLAHEIGHTLGAFDHGICDGSQIPCGSNKCDRCVYGLTEERRCLMACNPRDIEDQLTDEDLFCDNCLTIIENHLEEHH